MWIEAPDSFRFTRIETASSLRALVSTNSRKAAVNPCLWLKPTLYNVSLDAAFEAPAYAWDTGVKAAAAGSALVWSHSRTTAVHSVLGIRRWAQEFHWFKGGLKAPDDIRDTRIKAASFHLAVRGGDARIATVYSCFWVLRLALKLLLTERVEAPFGFWFAVIVAAAFFNALLFGDSWITTIVSWFWFNATSVSLLLLLFV